MAGKTFRGVGDDEDASLSRDAAPLIADEDEAQGLHSGPTVVDDKKVEEVLRKLRSLDKPPGPLTGVTQAVPDTSSEPTRLDSGQIEIDTAPHVMGGPGSSRIDELMAPLRQRPTAIGRSLSTPVAGQPVTVPSDVVRGTVFGHSIHLPDVNAPDELRPEASSGALLDGTPPPLQPFPLAERPPLPPLAPPVDRLPPVQRFHLPFDPDTQTQLVDHLPRSKTLRNAVAFLGGLAIVGGGLLAWSHWGGRHEDASAPAATTTAPTPTAPTAEIAPIEPSPQPAAGAAPAAGSAPAEAARAPKVEKLEKVETADEVPARAPAPADEPTPPAPAVKIASGAHRAAQASGRHAAHAAPAASDETPAAGKPGRGHKRSAAVPEDPDATLPPTM